MTNRLRARAPRPCACSWRGIFRAGRGVLSAPSVRVLVLSASGERQDVLDAMTAGATGYLMKSAAERETEVLRLVAKGLTYPQIAARPGALAPYREEPRAEHADQAAPAQQGPARPLRTG